MSDESPAKRPAQRSATGRSVLVNAGGCGGFDAWCRDHMAYLCLGWVSVVYFRRDMEVALSEMMREYEEGDRE